MKKALLFVALLTGLLGMGQFKYSVDKKIEPYYLQSIEDLKHILPLKDGVRILFVDKHEKQSRYGAAYTILHDDYIIINVSKKWWKDLTNIEKQAVMTHELLHSFGYKHSKNPDSLMYWDVSRFNTYHKYVKALKIALNETR